MEKLYPKMTRAHQVYKDEQGETVPNVSKILSVLNKSALVKWANNLGLQGIDSSKYTDKMANIGTLAHAMICAHLMKQKMDTSEFSPSDVSLAENAVIKYFEWEKDKEIEPIMIEAPMVSKELRYGGQVDLYCKLNGTYTLIDFKTSKGIYPEMMYQLSAYKNLLIENGNKVERVIILRIGRDENEGFEEKNVGELDIHFRIFKNCLDIINAKKLLNE